MVQYTKKLSRTQKLVLMAIFAFQLMLSIVVLVLSCLWKHWIGVVFVVIFGLLVMTAFAATIRERLQTQNKLAKIIYSFFNISFSFIIIIFLVVQVSAWDKPVSHFPSVCTKTTNCCRLTSVNSSNVQATGFSSPFYNTTIDNVKSGIKSWIKTYNSAGILYESDTFIQTRFVTFFFGFPDDFYVELLCKNGSVNVWVQSESRLGTGDFGVNRERVTDFLQKMNEKTFTLAKCS